GYSVNRSPASLRAMLGKGASNMARLLPSMVWPAPHAPRSPREVTEGPPELSIEIITLKQFRAVEDPSRACYQALIASQMGFDRLNHGGLLGDLHLLRGDPSGGFTIRIHQYGSQPIIESLGLEVTANEHGREGDQVAILKPTFPFWNDVDLYYGAGQVICSRTSTQGFVSQWRDEQAPSQAAPVASGPTVAKASDDKP